MVISIDLDGCVFENKYPDLGDILPNAKEVINYWFDRSHTIVINTCRANGFAENAKNYLTQKGFKFNYFNENDPRLIEKYNTDTRKISANVYIDDLDINDIILRKQLGIEEYNESLWTRHLEQFQFIEKPVIICIVGESGAGKSLTAQYLDDVYDISIVNSYTNRDRRDDKDNDHVFLTHKEYNHIEGEKLAETTFGEEGKIQYNYCSLVSDMDHINSYLITEDGYEELCRKWDSVYDIYALKIERPLFDRISDVGEERCNRDAGRFNMKDDEFDWVIYNNLNQKEYLYNLIEEFMNSTRLAQRAKDYDVFITDF